MKDKLKVTQQVKDDYQNLCPLSFHNCESNSDIEYKIKKCVRLGTVVEIFNNKQYIYSQYFHNLFKVRVEKNNLIIESMEKVDSCVQIKQEDRDYYDI